MIKVVVFDIGNVVWRYEPLYQNLHKSLADILNLSYDDYFQEYQKVYRGFEVGTYDLFSWIQSIKTDIEPQQIQNILSASFG